jgi:hypothetical protein
MGEDKYRVWRTYMGGSTDDFDRGWLSVQILGSKPLENGTMPSLRGARGNGAGEVSFADRDPTHETVPGKEDMSCKSA